MAKIWNLRSIKRNGFALIAVLLTFLAMVPLKARAQQDPSDYFLSHYIESKVEWTGIRPRSYTVSVDFTYSKKHGVRVLEFNGPSYISGHTNYAFLKKLFLKFPDSKWTEPFTTLTSGSGHAGHDEVYKMPLDTIIARSAAQFAEDHHWPLRKVFNLDNLREIPVDCKAARQAVFLSRYAIQTVPWSELCEDHLLFNHPDILTTVYDKSLMMLLPEVEGMTVPTTTFLRKGFKSARSQIVKFVKDQAVGLFILKPANAFASKGVRLVRKEQLLAESTKEIEKFLEGYDGWILQPYMPSDLYKDKYEELRTPVGRMFYHLIFDGENFRVVPLTAYMKLNSLRLKNPNDMNNPNIVEFSALEDAAKYPKDDLKKIVKNLNQYFAKVGPALFQLSQQGLDGDTTEAKEMRQRFEALSASEQAVVRKLPYKYAYVIHEGVYDAVWKNYRPKYISIQQSIELMPSPIYQSLKCIDALKNKK